MVARSLSPTRSLAAALAATLLLGSAGAAPLDPAAFAGAARAVKGSYDPAARSLLEEAGLWQTVGEELADAGAGAHPAEDAHAARNFAYASLVEGSDDTRLLRALARLDAQGFFTLGLPRALGALRRGEPVPEPVQGGQGYDARDLRVFPSRAWSEEIRPDEEAEFAAMAEAIQRIQERLADGGPTKRGFHAKSHGNVRARLEIRGDLPPELRHGLFASPATYDCFVRFSNGVGIEQNDWKPDVRGVALKVTGVEGEALPGSQPGVQDFLATNQPASLARDASQFMAFARGNVRPLKLPLVLFRELGLKEGGRILKTLAGFAFQRTRSVVASTYWTGARQYGPWAARFLLAPSGEVTAPRRKLASSYLREEFRARLKKAEVRMDLLAHLYVDDEATPIEDGATPWDEGASPPVKLATLVIPSTDLSTPEAKALEERIEAMAFNPWNGLAAHRPLGHLMRARAAVYRSSARFRGAEGVQGE